MTHCAEHKHDSPRTPRATYQDVLDTRASRRRDRSQPPCSTR